jgi:glycosyltransferase involved in cell wall biosynthesis
MNSIAFISKSHVINSIGGAEMQADILARALAEKGWDVVYITNAISNSQYYNKYKLIPAPSVKTSFKECLSQINADIYYQRGRKDLTSWVGELCKETKKKFVFSIANDNDCKKYKYVFRDPESPSEIIKQGLYFLKNLKLNHESLQGIYQADLVLAQTHYQKRMLKEKLGIESEVFYNIHDIPLRNRKVKNNKIPVILWLANVKDRKQPEIFLKLAEEMKNVKCRFLMAGELKSMKYRKLINKTSKNNSNFEYIGPVAMQKSNSLFAIADIFVNTSDNQEGFPNNLIQAWLHGVPTVSLLFDPDGLIVSKRMGFVAGNNYLKLKESVYSLLNDPKLRIELGENARIFSSDNFNQKKKINNFIELLQR